MSEKGLLSKSNLWFKMSIHYLNCLKKSFRGRKQITLNVIKLFIEEDYVTTAVKFVEKRANYLENEGILEKHVLNPVIYSIIK